MEKPRKSMISRVRQWLGGGRAVALALLVALCLIRTVDSPLLETMRHKTFDFYQQRKPRQVPVERPVTIVDLDERSLEAIGQWPWPRNVVARLVDKLTGLGAVVIAFDIVFAEPDRMSPALLAASVEGIDADTASRLKSLPGNDAVLAQSIARSRVVLGQTGINAEGRSQRPNPPTTSVAELGGNAAAWLERFPTILRNVSEIDDAAAGHGVFTVHPELDGIVRRIPAMVTAERRLYPSLAMEMLRVATGNQSMGIRVNPETGVQGIVIRPNLIATDEAARIYLYASPYDREKYISARDVLEDRVDPARIAGRLVLVGTSAAGLLDIRATAIDRHIPGVELHAQIIESIMTGQQLIRPADSLGVELVATLGIGFLMVVLVPIVGASWSMGLFLCAAALIGGGSWLMFDRQLLLYDPVYPVATAIFLYIQLTYSAYSREEAQRRQVRGAFSRYMSPALVEQLAADPGKLKLGGEMREMTLLFCDVRGFTTISEQFTAEGLTHLINRFLTPMTDQILARRGTIDKYMGDCIMAFWNAPLDDDKHAAHACSSALAMQHRLVRLNEELKEEAAQESRKHIPLAIGIGLNSGTVCVGNMGSDQRFDYSVLGDSVNLASRLEGQSKTYGVTIVIGENTRERAPDFATLPLDMIKVKGKTEAVRIHALLGEPELRDSAEFQALEAGHLAMMECYRAQDWVGARRHLLASRGLAQQAGCQLEGFYDLYEERIGQYEQDAPGVAWNGVFVATSK